MEFLAGHAQVKVKRGQCQNRAASGRFQADSDVVIVARRQLELTRNLNAYHVDI